jgi:hypothetical protein
LIESRDAQLGAQIGTEFAEGFVVRDVLQRTTLFRMPDFAEPRTGSIGN